jgi:hypothetical protein
MCEHAATPEFHKNPSSRSEVIRETDRSGFDNAISPLFRETNVGQKYYW